MGLQGYINVVEATHVRSEATTGLQGFTNAPLPTLIKGTGAVGVLVARSAGTTFSIISNNFLVKVVSIWFTLVNKIGGQRAPTCGHFCACRVRILLTCTPPKMHVHSKCSARRAGYQDANGPSTLY